MATPEYQPVANKKDLQEGRLLKVQYLGRPVVLSMVKGKVYALDAVCSHEGGPLEEGTLEGYEVECPWHGSKFESMNYSTMNTNGVKSQIEINKVT